MTFDAAAVFGLHGLTWSQVLDLWWHFTLLSMLAIGGAITTTADMQRYLVQEQGWMSAEQFTASVAIAQAAPGPNLLFAALMGWNVAGAAGLVATLVGLMLPSSTLALAMGRYGHRRAESLPMRAFTTGMVPLTIGLLLATGWVLAAPGAQRWGTYALVAGTVLAMLRTRIGPLWLIAGGAVAGMLGWA